MAKQKRRICFRNLVRACAAGVVLAALAHTTPAHAAVCDVTKYGATGNGKSLDTAAIQKAIDACNAAGGGTVLFSNGRFLTGLIFLKSNITLRIEPGAVLLGSANVADFENHQSGAKVEGLHCIYADNVDNIAIEGGGVIDGQGDSYFDADMHPRRRPSPFIEIWNSRDVRIEDITIRKTPGWAIHPKNCDRVKIRGISLINNFNAINTDGIDPDSSRNVIISDSYIESGDDTIVLKTSNRGGAAGPGATGPGAVGPSAAGPTENVTVTNCVLVSAASALKLGTESWGDFRHCVFSNCVIRRSRTGIALLAKDGGTMEDVRFENITMDTAPKWGKGVEWPIEFDIEKRSEKSRLSHIRDITLSDITMVTKGRVLIEGMPESLIDTLTMRNVIMRITGYEQIKNAHKNRGGTGGLKDAVDFGNVPSALIFANARNIDLNDIHVIWPEGPAQERTGLFTKNVTGLTTTNLNAPPSTGGPNSATR